MDPKTALFLLLQEYKSRTELGGLDALYPEEGPLRRELYHKHTAMLAAGKEFNERACFGGNRVGKTLSIGGFETALHLTGLYPDWWEGHRFNHKILVWAAGTKAVKVRNVEDYSVRIQYQFEFRDKNDLPLRAQTGWRFHDLPSRIEQTLRGSAMELEGVSWVLRMRPAM